MKRQTLIVKPPRPDMSFEDAVRHILKAGPMPKAAKAKPRKKTPPKKGQTE